MPARTRANRTIGLAYGFLTPTLLLMVVLMVIPIGMVIWYSLQNNVVTNKNPVFVGFDQYVKLFADPAFHTALGNTVVFVLISVAAHLVLGLAFAMLLNTPLLPHWVKTVFRTIFVLPWLLTVAIVAVLWRLILNPNGVLNHLLNSIGLIDGPKEWLADPNLALGAVTFISVWYGYPFFMISLLAGLQGISSDMYEAAQVDGAGPVQRFFKITLPSLKPIIISMTLLDLINTSHQFTLVWMTTGGGPLDRTELLSTYTYSQAFSKYMFSTASASGVIFLLVSAALAYLYVRQQNKKD